MSQNTRRVLSPHPMRFRGFRGFRGQLKKSTKLQVDLHLCFVNSSAPKVPRFMPSQAERTDNLLGGPSNP
jgi:hypothetical protein